MGTRPSSRRRSGSSVEDAGLAGYEYQYLVTIWLLLDLWNENLQSCLVEGGLEDAIFDLLTPGGSYHLELQAKSEKKATSVQKLAAWLTHFPKRSAENPLLDWLRENDTRGIVFATVGRVDEGLKELLLGSGGLNRPHRPREKTALSRRWAGGLRTAIGKRAVGTAASRLEIQRQEYCKELAEKISVTELQRLSRRIFILEQWNEDRLAEEVNRILSNQFRVPQSMAAFVRSRLVGLCPKARTEGLNIVPLVRDALSEFSAPKIFSAQVHVARSIEPRLLAELNTGGVLLLTGPMHCGKTHTGRFVAQKLQEQGFVCREIEDTEVARRFLLDGTTSEDRLVLLHDPFGKIDIKADCFEKWEQVRSLVAHLSSNRKIIVTCRQSILHALRRDQAFELAGHSWADLVLADLEIALEIWRATSQGQEPEVIAAVEGGLRTIDVAHLLQPGEIYHLAHQRPEALRCLTPDELLRAGRFDAAEIGQWLVKHGSAMHETLGALALTATAVSRVSVENLAFILGDTDSFPGRMELGLGRLYGGSGEPIPLFPEYLGGCPLALNYRDSLDDLESRGVIEQDRGYRFRHPVYEQAGFEAFRDLPSFRFERMAGLARRAMFSLSSATAKCAVEFVHQLRRREGNPEKWASLTNLSFEAFYSIFPIVRDATLKELLRDFESLDRETQRRLLDIIESQWGWRKNILWHFDEPWFDTRSSISWSELGESSTNAVAISEARRGLQALAHGERLGAKKMWILLDAATKGLEQLDLQTIEQALSYEEAIIRSEAAFLLLRDRGLSAAALVMRVVEDSNPMVVAEAVRGLVKGWLNYDDETRSRLCSILRPTLEHPSRAILGIRVVTRFEKISGRYGPEAPWDLWAEIAVPILNAVPRHSWVNEEHLFRMFTIAIPVIGRVRALEILTAWVGWIEAVLTERLPEDFGLGVTDLLLTITGRDSEIRRDLVARLCSQEDTAFRATVVSDLVNGWRNLDEVERRHLLLSLREPRPDLRWLQSAALTVRSPPPEVVELLLGDGFALHLAPEKVLARFSPELLDACLAMYTGFPQPLLWIGLHHRTSGPWETLLRTIARDAGHSLFDLAIKELLRGVAMYAETEELSEIWSQLATESTSEVCGRLFGHLLRSTATINGVPYEGLWITLLGASGARDLREQWLDKVTDALPSIEYYSNLEIFYRTPGFGQELFRRFPSDLQVWMLIEQPLSSQVGEQILDLYEESPPKLLRTHDRALAVLRDGLGWTDRKVAAVVEARLQWFDCRKNERGRWDDEYELQDWVRVSRRTQMMTGSS